MTDAPKHKFSHFLSRRRVVAGGAAAAAVTGLGVAGSAFAGSSSDTEATATATATDASTSATDTVCALNAETTEGPYSLEGALVRRDISEDKPGVQIRYTFTVVDTSNDCAPLEDALVEIWHCDHLGEYSGFVGGNGHEEEDNGTFLRGGYLTSSSGKVHITSIWPGHYVSRAVHVHLRVHTGVTLEDGTYTGGNICHTGQLFFDPEINAKIQAASPYSENTTQETLLSEDTIYDDGGAASGYLTIKEHGKNAKNGYRATLTIGVDSTATSSGGGGGGGGGGTPPSGPPPTGTPPTDAPSTSASTG